MPTYGGVSPQHKKTSNWWHFLCPCSPTNISGLNNWVGISWALWPKVNRILFLASYLDIWRYPKISIFMFPRTIGRQKRKLNLETRHLTLCDIVIFLDQISSSSIFTFSGNVFDPFSLPSLQLIYSGSIITSKTSALLSPLQRGFQLEGNERLKL